MFRQQQTLQCALAHSLSAQIHPGWLLLLRCKMQQ